jgi:hypothetical protein
MVNFKPGESGRSSFWRFIQPLRLQSSDPGFASGRDSPANTYTFLPHDGNEESTTQIFAFSVREPRLQCGFSRGPVDLRVRVTILSIYPDYFPPRFDSLFLQGRGATLSGA